MRLTGALKTSALKRTKHAQPKHVQPPQSDYDACSYTDTHRAIMTPSAQITPHMPDGGWAAMLPVLVIAGSGLGLLFASLAWAILSFGL
jgi:hypothetical protein